MHPPCLMLDVDGVLNSADYLHNRRKIRRPTPHAIDAVTVPRLNEILRRSGAKVVISSSWRIQHPWQRMQEILTAHGVVCDVIGQTPSLYEPLPQEEACDKYSIKRRERGHEIQAWLNEHPEVTRFAIVDDNSDMVHLAHKLVQTTWEMGLLDEHIEPLVKMLLAE